MPNCLSKLRGRNLKWLAAIGLVAAVLVAGGLAFWAWERPRLEKHGEVTVVVGAKIKNMRDLGGLKTRDGRTVKHGMVYRSAAFNSVKREGRSKVWTIPEESRKFLTQELGIKTDLDLRRGDGETQGMTESPLGAGVHWAHIRGRSYARLGDPDGKEGFAQAFRLLLDEKRYPFVVHCQRGKDRAGTLVAMLEALLGVPLEGIRNDYRFSWSGRGHSHFDAQRFDELLKMLAGYPGKDINEQAVAFAKALGFTDADLAHFRAIMLEK